MPITLGLDKTIQLLRNALDRRGAGYVYKDDSRFPQDEDGDTRCVYVARDENGDPCPACLVGEVFAEAGVSLTLFLNTPYFENRSLNEMGVLRLKPHLPKFDLLVTPAALEALHKAQNIQDSGGTWGEAVNAGIEAGESYVDF